MNTTPDKQKTAYRSYVREEYGTVVSVDITPKLMKEFLTAQMYLGAFPTATNSETFDKDMEAWESKVRPFFEHFEEMLDTL